MSSSDKRKDESREDPDRNPVGAGDEDHPEIPADPFGTPVTTGGDEGEEDVAYADVPGTPITTGGDAEELAGDSWTKSDR